MEGMSYVFSFTFFSLLLIFTLHLWLLAFLIFSPPLKNFHVVFPTKKWLLCFLSLALDLCCPFSGWPLLACCLLSLFLCLCLPLYSKLVDMTINLSLILWTTWIQKQFLLSVFVFIHSLFVFALQDAGGFAISRQNNLELHLGCHTCTHVEWVILHWYACGADRRMVNCFVYGHLITKFSRMDRFS